MVTHILQWYSTSMADTATTKWEEMSVQFTHNNIDHNNVDTTCKYGGWKSNML